MSEDPPIFTTKSCYNRLQSKCLIDDAEVSTPERRVGQSLRPGHQLNVHMAKIHIFGS